MYPLNEEEVKRQIEELKNISIPKLIESTDPIELNEYSKKVRDEIQKILKFPLLLTQTAVNDPGQSFTFYRCRRRDGFANPNIFTEYNYPPIAFSKKIQRANLPCHPVFYASNHALTTMEETLQYGYTKGEILMISRWTMRDTEPYKIAPILFHGLSKTHPYYLRVKDIEENDVKKAFPEATENEYKSVLLILKELSNQFIKSKDYRISASIAHSHLYSDQRNLRADILIYPSVCTDGRSVNFAINPNFVDNRVFLEEVFAVQIGNYDKTTKHLRHRLLYHGEVNGSEILWNQMKKENPKYDELSKLYNMRFR